MAIYLHFHEKFVSEWARISVILFPRHCTTHFFYFRAIATCATFFWLLHWRGGAKSSASAQHRLKLI